MRVLRFILSLACFAIITGTVCADDAPVDTPKHKFVASITSDGPLFNYINDKPYKLSFIIANLSSEEMGLEKLGVRWELQGSAAKQDLQIKAEPDGELPASILPGGETIAHYNITFPSEAARKRVVLIGNLDYSIGDNKHSTDCRLALDVSPKCEITLLPAKLILDPRKGSEKIGMSVINHSDDILEGKIKLVANGNLKIEPAEFDCSVDSRNLEAYIFGVSADAKLVPGHYAVFLDVADKTKEWIAVDIPVLVEKAKIEVDGTPDDWSNVRPIKIAKLVDGRYETVGALRYAYDDIGLLVLVELDDDEHTESMSGDRAKRGDSIKLAFDTLVNGAASQTGGYKKDDYEYEFGMIDGRHVVRRTYSSDSDQIEEAETVLFAFNRLDNKSIYEICVPWSSLAPIKPGKNAMLALSLLVEDVDSSGTTYIEWGGGIHPNIDPRLFVPLILVEQGDEK